jgi:hypothetical protein
MRNPHHPGSYWAMWWGISFALVFLVAATISFSMSGQQPSTELVYAVPEVR